MVVTQLVVQWFQGAIPYGMELPTTLLFIHLLAPALGTGGEADASPFVSDLYTFALYQTSGGIQLPGTEAWVQACFAGCVWKIAPDPVSATIGQFSCIQLGSQIVLDAGGPMLRTDPFLASGLIVTGLGVALVLTR